MKKMFNRLFGMRPATPPRRRSTALDKALHGPHENRFAQRKTSYDARLANDTTVFDGIVAHLNASRCAVSAKERGRPPVANQTRCYVWYSRGNRFFLPMGLFFVSLFCSLLAAVAQEPRDRGADGFLENSGLRIGDEIPEEFWNLSLAMLDPGQKLSTRSMRDYAGSDLLVLDFWSTWCGTCISSMKHGEALRNTYGDRLHLLLVTTQTANEVVSFAQKNDIVDNTSLPLVINDAALRMFFRHRTLPHMVFIRNNKVVHIGGSESMSDALFATALQGKTPEVNYYKDDYAFKRPLIPPGNIAAHGPKRYNLLSGYRQDSAPAEGLLADSAQGTKRLYYYNQPLLTLIARALQLDDTPLNRIVFENTDYTLESIAYHRLFGDKLQWLPKHSLCYESVVSLDAPEPLLRESMAFGLQQLLGIRFALEERRIPVLRLQAGGKLARKAAEARSPMYHVLDTYNRLPSSLPLIDPDSLTNGLHYPKQNTAELSTKQLLALLEDAGLRVVPTKAVMPVLVIKGRDDGTL